MENFIEIPRYSGYFINKNGVVLSKKTKKTMKQKIGNRGYASVSLIKDKKQYTEMVHRLVLESFIGQSRLTINHINGVRLDNNLENLEYCTQSDNIKHAYRIGSKNANSVRGSKNHCAILNEADVLEIKRELKNGVNQAILRRKFNVSWSLIYKIRIGKTWKHV